MQDFLTVFKKDKGAKLGAGDIIRVPDFDTNTQLNSQSFVLYGDATNENFSNAGDKLPYIRFSSKTEFPSVDKMPDGFNPEQVLENGKAPGLGIGDLHTMGITGKGITVAIIDQPLNTEHIEIKDNIVHYESAGYPEHIEAQFHGTAVSSLLAGKTVGVAPDAKIVYFAANQLAPGYDGEKTLKMGGYDVYFANYATALRRILFMNSRLPKDQKISAVSISWGMLGENEECAKLINQLIDSGVMVLTTDSDRFYGNKAAFMTIDRKMNANPDFPESYTAGFWKKHENQPKDCLLIPAGGRTLAGFYSNNDYIYCGVGAGMSWAAPYLTGVYALAKQVAPNLTPHHFFEVAQQTAISNGKTGDNKIVQPQKIIQQLQNEMVLQQQQIVGKDM